MVLDMMILLVFGLCGEFSGDVLLAKPGDDKRRQAGCSARAAGDQRRGSDAKK